MRRSTWCSWYSISTSSGSSSTTSSCINCCWGRSRGCGCCWCCCCCCCCCWWWWWCCCCCRCWCSCFVLVVVAAAIGGDDLIVVVWCTNIAFRYRMIDLPTINVWVNYRPFLGHICYEASLIIGQWTFPISLFTRWWFQTLLYVHHYLGKIPILTNIFQMGWNHQLV